MGNLVISPVQWATFEDIEDTKPVDEGDYTCMSEVREVLKRHGMQDRFGLALLHSHFDLQQGEAFLEEVDEQERLLITRIVPEPIASEGNIGTIWHLREGEVNVRGWCRRYCHDGWFGHSKQHNYVNGR